MNITSIFAGAILLASTMTSAFAANTIVDVATRAGTFGTLLAAATAAGLADELTEVDGLTVFAPNDAAFARLPAGTVESLLQPANRERLRAIIAYHIVPARVPAEHIAVKPKLVETLNGCERVRTLRNRHTGAVTVDQSRVIRADLRASNGIVHVINRVLIPARNCP